MEYYQGIVADYVSADRATFVANEYLLELERGKQPYWWIDTLAVSLKEETAYLCEVTFSKQLSKIAGKVRAFYENMEGISAALHREASIPSTWKITPWLFVPRLNGPQLVERLQPALIAKITYLEDVAPWIYPNGWRDGEPTKPYADIPEQFQ